MWSLANGCSTTKRRFYFETSSRTQLEKGKKEEMKPKTRANKQQHKQTHNVPMSRANNKPKEVIYLPTYQPWVMWSHLLIVLIAESLGSP